MADTTSTGGVVEEMPVKPVEPNDSAILSSNGTATNESDMNLAKMTEVVRERTSLSGGSVSASPTFDFESGFYKVVFKNCASASLSCVLLSRF